jgi:hypothetical protein
MAVRFFLVILSAADGRSQTALLLLMVRQQQMAYAQRRSPAAVAYLLSIASGFLFLTREASLTIVRERIIRVSGYQLTVLRLSTISVPILGIEAGWLHFSRCPYIPRIRGHGLDSWACIASGSREHHHRSRQAPFKLADEI